MTYYHRLFYGKSTHKFINTLLLASVIHILSINNASTAVYFESFCRANHITTKCNGSELVSKIYIFDEIDSETATKIEQFSAQLPLNQKFPPVYLNSRGGHLSSAEEIGRVLRMRSASVFQKDILFPHKEAICYSACAMIAAGATSRNLASIGLHKGYIEKRIKGHNYEKSQMDDEGLKKIYNYYNEMGISPEIRTIIENTPDDQWSQIKIDQKQPFENQDLRRLGFLNNKEFFIEYVHHSRQLERADTNGGEAMKLLSEKNDLEATHKLGERFIHGLDGELQDVNKGLYYLTKSADKGDVWSLHQLGTYFNSGYCGIPKDTKKAFNYYLKAAKRGFAGSQNNLAWHYYKGDGVEKNLSEAIYWVTRAIEQGEPFGYSTLSTMRFEGNGFIKDDVETYKWSLLASMKLPDGTAKQDQVKQLNVLTIRMTNTEIEQAKKRASEWKPLYEGGLTMRDKDDL